MRQAISLCAAILFACTGVPAQSDSSQGNTPPSAARSADSLAHDQHDGLTLSADPYTDPGRAKQKFNKANPLPLGILPVEVFLHNETNHAMRIDLSTVQLTVRFSSGRHQDVDWLPIEEVAAKVAHPGGPPAPHSPRFPVGIPSVTDKKIDKMAEILRPLALDVAVLPPLSTIHGFLFFDLNDDISLAENASLYVPDVTAVPSNKPMMFFEVPFHKAQQP